MSSSGKRKLDDDDDDSSLRNTTGKALFVRDSNGDMITVLPGQLMPEKVQAATEEASSVVADADAKREEARLAARSEEDVQYEAYLAGKDNKRGNVWIQNAGQASADKAMFADSISAQIAEEREARGDAPQYAAARAHDRGHKMKKQAGASSTGGGTYGGATSLAEARAGAAKAQEALERAREASDDDDDDDDELNRTASQLAERAMAAYNLPVSSMPQLDPHGNDLNIPLRERKLRKFLECFAEEAAVKTVESNAAVLKDFEDIRKRYSTVFRESGAELKGRAHKRWAFEKAAGGGGGGEEEEEDDDDDDDGSSGATFCLQLERHTHLITPKPGLPLDGSLGVTPPRTQDLAVVYQAEGGEISGMWIMQDKAGLGADAEVTREAIEETELFKACRRLIERLSGGARFGVQFAS